MGTGYFKLTEKNEASRDFGRLFGLPFGDYYDSIISIFDRRIHIDILKFDERMHLEHGDYEDEGLSLNECIELHYGKEASELIGKLL